MSASDGTRNVSVGAESTYSVIISEAAARAATLATELENTLSLDDPVNRLARYFSTRTVLSTTSSLGRQQQEAESDESLFFEKGVPKALPDVPDCQ